MTMSAPYHTYSPSSCMRSTISPPPHPHPHPTNFTAAYHTGRQCLKCYVSLQCFLIAGEIRSSWLFFILMALLLLSKLQFVWWNKASVISLPLALVVGGRCNPQHTQPYVMRDAERTIPVRISPSVSRLINVAISIWTLQDCPTWTASLHRKNAYIICVTRAMKL